ncbi:MAG: hypothetical protein IPG59_11770 [Candidatus Melainabacteria bacterium]|nr:MAG: hypothetical protein IPG59_11770 [Candidatus Melainabacteria bacterium]
MTKKSDVSKAIIAGAVKVGKTPPQHADNSVIVHGTGSADLNLPSADEMCKKAIKDLEQLEAQAKAKAKKQKRNGRRRNGKPLASPIAAGDLIDHHHPTGPLLSIAGKGPVRKALTPTTLAEQVLIAGAQGLQVCMERRKFDPIAHQLFASQQIFALAEQNLTKKQNLPAKYLPIVQEGNRQIPKIRARFEEALPQLVEALKQRNPGAPEDQIIKAAVQMLMKQLGPFLFVFRMYEDALTQNMDGIHKKVIAVMDYIFQTSFKLLVGIDPIKDDDTAQPKLDLNSFTIKDLFIYMFTGQGLSIVPGARGMLGVHVLNMPFEFAEVMPILASLSGGHEYFHPILPDINGYEAELMTIIPAELKNRVSSGALKLSTASYDVAGNQLAADELLAKILTDQLGEQAADLCGGVSLYGPEFPHTVLMGFPAMMVRGVPVSQVSRTLRNESHFSLEQGDNPNELQLVFEPHPVDYVRVLQDAYAVRVLGFDKEADELEALAHFAAGTPTPTDVTWTLSDEQTKLEIKIPVSDVLEASKVVVDILLNKKLVSLGGKSMSDLVRWTKKSQDKAEAICAKLVAGSSDLPVNIGTIRATHVVSGTTMAYRKLLVKNGVVITDPVEQAKVATDLSNVSMDMLTKLCQCT